MHDWIVPLELNDDIEVDGEACRLSAGECVIRFDQDESFGKLWRASAEVERSDGVHILDLFHEDQEPYSPKMRRKNPIKSWSQVERRHQVFKEIFESGPHKVVVALQRMT